MSAASGSYLEVFSEFRTYDNYNELFEVTMSKLTSELNLSSVKSCLAVGPGDGEYEVAFIKQCVSNISQFIAVEPDHESLELLRTRLAKSLPDVDSQVIETKIESWEALDEPVDLVLLMCVLYYISANDRKQLFKKLHDRWLTTGGYMVVVNSSGTKCPGNICEIYERLDQPVPAWEDIETELLQVGFIKQFADVMKCVRDFSTVDEHLVRFMQNYMHRPITLDQVRGVVQQLFPDKKCDQMIYTLAVFQKA